MPLTRQESVGLGVGVLNIWSDYVDAPSMRQLDLVINQYVDDRIVAYVRNENDDLGIRVVKIDELRNLRAKKIHKISLPAKNITNCTFAGHKNNELYISTARKGLKSYDLKKYPLSGSLFKVKTNLKGKKPVSFKTLYSVF